MAATASGEAALLEKLDEMIESRRDRLKRERSTSKGFPSDLEYEFRALEFVRKMIRDEEGK